MPHPIRQGDIPGVQLRRDLELPVRRSDVWRWLSEVDLMRRWLADEVVVEPEEVRLESVAEDGRQLSERGRTLAREDEVVWSMAFERLDDDWESATELRLTLSGSEPCQLTVLQRGFERLSLSRCLPIWELYRRRWQRALERLASEVGASSV